ncbi:hypothetical protein B9G55_05940 [Saccharibacillus sp. O16]|nr:hypothetical protein B9G55_05940 [Saccharibacillus sp. O16]
MRLAELKDTMLIPDREVVLNRLIQLNGTDVLLLSITSQDKIHRLWTLRSLPESYYEESSVDPSEDAHSIRNRKRAPDLFSEQEDHVSKMLIQNQIMTFRGMQGFFCTEQDHETYMYLQYFIEKGMDLAHFADVELNRLALYSYEQDSSEPFPDLDLERELDMVFTFNSQMCSMPIHTEPILLEFGDVPQENRYSFYDSFHQKNRSFYINRLRRYDIWAEVQKHVEQPIPPQIDPAEWLKFRDQYMENIQHVCPQGQELAVLEYEAEDNIQLHFYSKDDLDSEPRPFEGSLRMGISVGPEHPFGVHGLRLRACTLGAVSRTFAGSLVVELWSHYVELPEKTLKV